MQPAAPRPLEPTLKPDALKRLLDEQKTLSAELRMLPNRADHAARRIDRLAPNVAELERQAKQHRTSIDTAQEQLDGHRNDGVLHRARHSKTMERLETFIGTEQQRLAPIQERLDRDRPALQQARQQFADIQQHRQTKPERLTKVSALIDQDRDARLTNSRRSGKIPEAVAEAIKPLGKRPAQDKPKERAAWERTVGGALQQHHAHGKIDPIKPPEQEHAKQIVRRGPSLTAGRRAP